MFFVNKEYSVIFTGLKIMTQKASYLGRFLRRAGDVFLELKFPQFLLFPFPSPLFLLPSLPILLLFPLVLGLSSLNTVNQQPSTLPTQPVTYLFTSHSFEGVRLGIMKN